MNSVFRPKFSSFPENEGANHGVLVIITVLSQSSRKSESSFIGHLMWYLSYVYDNLQASCSYGVSSLWTLTPNPFTSMNSHATTPKMLWKSRTER